MQLDHPKQIQFSLRILEKSCFNLMYALLKRSVYGFDFFKANVTRRDKKVSFAKAIRQLPVAL